MLLKMVLTGVLAWLVGIFGWAQIVGSIRDIRDRKKHWFTLILWIVILAGLGYLAVTRFDGLLPLAVGYGFALVMVLSVGKAKK